MLCPVCSSPQFRRSRKQNLIDILAREFGYVPWRCLRCRSRFRARVIPYAHTLSAHCGICGAIEVKRVSGDAVVGYLALFWSLFRVPAFRCEACRHNFFSLMPHKSQKEYDHVAAELQ